MAGGCGGFEVWKVLVVVCIVLLATGAHSADYTYISRSALRQVIREELRSLGRSSGGGQSDSQLRPMLTLILQHVQDIARRTSDHVDRSPSFIQALEGRLDAFTQQLDAKAKRHEDHLCESFRNDLHQIKTKVDFLTALMRQKEGEDSSGRWSQRSRDLNQENHLIPQNPRDTYVPPRPLPTPQPVPSVPSLPNNKDPRHQSRSNHDREYPPRQPTPKPHPWHTQRSRQRQTKSPTRQTHRQDSSSSHRTYIRRQERINPQPHPQPRPKPDRTIPAIPRPARPTPGVSIYRRMPSQCPSYLAQITGSEVFRKARNSMIGVWMKDTGVSSDTIWAVESSNALHWSTLSQYINEDDFRRHKVSTVHKLTAPCSGLGPIMYKGDLFCQAYGRDPRSLQIMRYSLRDRRVIARSSISSRTGGHVSHPYRGWAGVYLHLQLAVDEMGLHVIFGEGNNKHITIFRLDVNSLQTLETWRTEKPKNTIGPTFMICGVLYALDSHYAGYISYAYDTKTLKDKTLPSSRIPVPIQDMSSIHYNPMDHKLYAWTMTRPKNQQHGTRSRRIYGVAERVSLDLSGQTFLRLR